MNNSIKQSRKEQNTLLSLTSGRFPELAGWPTGLSVPHAEFLIGWLAVVEQLLIGGFTVAQLLAEIVDEHLILPLSPGKTLIHLL